MMALQRAQDSGASEISHNLSRVCPLYHRQSANVVPKQFCDCVMQCFIRIGDDHVSRSSLGHGHRTISNLLEGTHNITACDNTSELTILVA